MDSWTSTPIGAWSCVYFTPFSGACRGFPNKRSARNFSKRYTLLSTFGVALGQFRCGAKEKVVMKSSLNPSFIKMGGLKIRCGAKSGWERCGAKSRWESRLASHPSKLPCPHYVPFLISKFISFMYILLSIPSSRYNSVVAPLYKF